MTTLLRFLIFSLIFFWFGLCLGASEKILRVYELKHTDVEKIIPVINQLIDTDGMVEKLDNRLIINSSSETQKKIGEFIQQIDTPKPTLLVLVRQTNSGMANAVHIGTHSTKQTVRTSSHLGNAQKSVVQHILVQDGEDAFIVEGEEIPYSSELAMVSGRHRGFARKISYKDVRTGFRVRPTLRGDTVEIEIVPFRENVHENHSPSIDNPPPISYQKGATKLRLPLNSWFELGSTVNNVEEEDIGTVRWRTGKNYQNSSIWIKIEEPSATVPSNNN